MKDGKTIFEEKPNMEFCKKNALVTGAAVGIGRATALELGKKGASLILLDVDTEGLQALARELEGIRGRVLTYTCDISDADRVNEVISDALAQMGHIDILVNNAALWRASVPFVEMDMELWKHYFDINVHGTAYVTKAVLPQMLERGYGRIINVASVAGVYGNAKMACYSATKGALISFTKALAKEVTDKGVLVNAVSPGSVSTSQNPDIDHTDPSTLSFMGRTGSDRENANLICFLASDAASYISGQNIQIDGCRKKQ